MLQIKTKLFVCEMFGIPIYVGWSSILLLIMLISEFGNFTLGCAIALVLAISIVLHELGHALTARAFGCRTRDITLSVLGGCASLISMPRRAWQEFLVALAGPLVSFMLSAVGWALLIFVEISNRWLLNVVVYLAWMNLMLGAFNLLPGFPLDGGRIFRSVMRAFLSKAKATYVAMVVGRIFAILLALRGVWSMVNGGSFAFISILIAWMIWSEGAREYQLAKAESAWDERDFGARVSPPPYDR